MVRGTALRTVWLPTRLRRCLFHKEFLNQKSHWEDGTVADQHRRLAKARRMICRRIRGDTCSRSSNQGALPGSLGTQPTGCIADDRDPDAIRHRHRLGRIPHPNRIPRRPRLTRHRTHNLPYNPTHDFGKSSLKKSRIPRGSQAV